MDCVHVMSSTGKGSGLFSILRDLYGHTSSKTTCIIVNVQAFKQEMSEKICLHCLKHFSCIKEENSLPACLYDFISSISAVYCHLGLLFCFCLFVVFRSIGSLFIYPFANGHENHEFYLDRNYDHNHLTYPSIYQLYRPTYL